MTQTNRVTAYVYAPTPIEPCEQMYKHAGKIEIIESRITCETSQPRRCTRLRGWPSPPKDTTPTASTPPPPMEGTPSENTPPPRRRTHPTQQTPTLGTMAPQRKGHRYRKAREYIKRTQRKCWICNELINLALRFPHPRSFSVDHVHPVGRGGAMVDISNLRAAHLECNQSRGDGTKPPIKNALVQQRNSRKW